MNRRSFLKVFTAAVAAFAVNIPAGQGAVAAAKPQTFAMFDLEAMLAAESERLSRDIMRRLMQPSPFLTLLNHEQA